MIRGRRVLVIGDMREGTNSASLAKAFAGNGAEVRTVDTSFIYHSGPVRKLLVGKFRQVDALANSRLRRELQAAHEGFAPDLLVAIKTIYFDQDLIFSSTAPVRIHYSFDDVSNPDNLSARYLQSESQWDFVVTTKRHNLAEIAARGGNPIFQWAAYDPAIHHVTKRFDSRKFLVGFVGAMRPDRAHLPAQLAETSDDDVVVAGPRWQRKYPSGCEGVTLLPPQMGAAYTSICNEIRIGLVLLNSENRDQHTNRSIETPATGQLVLAEDTPEHRELFDHGESALFFRSLAEAAEQISHLRRDPDRARQIASRGHQRVIRGEFTYTHRSAELLGFAGMT